jgi:hypothetical protein
MGRNWSEKELASVGKDPAPIATEAFRKVAAVRGPNKTEAAYALYLKVLSQTPGIHERVTWFAFEAIKIRIGVHCWFTPDYLVEYADGHLELHDCKGTKNEKYRAEDDAIVKARTVSAHFPLPVFFVFRLRNGEWQKVRM